MSQIYIGIDNGLTGGLVALIDHPSPPIDMSVMPTKSKAKGKGNEVDALAFYEWLISLNTPLDRMTVILETPGKHSPGVQALCSMWDSYGVLRGVLECNRIRHHRIAPQSWQAMMLPNCEKGDTKPAALTKARQLWPSETWIATSRSSKPHLGLIDAALIAEYGRMKRL